MPDPELLELITARRAERDGLEECHHRHRGDG